MLLYSDSPKRDEITGSWRKFYKQELQKVYSLPNIVRIMRSRRMRHTGQVACMRR
jgi:hypothetical protein